MEMYINHFIEKHCGNLNSKKKAEIRGDYLNLNRARFRDKHPNLAHLLWGPKPKINMPRKFRRML